MINTKENNVKENETLEIKTFLSLKNKSVLEYVKTFEENMMILCEADESYLKYEPFIFKMVNLATHKIEKYPAIVAETDDGLIYIILSDFLAANPKFGEGIRSQFQQYKSVPVTVALTPTNHLISDPLPNNLKFLYEFMVLPHEKKSFLKIKEILEFASEITLGQLKKQTDVISIYQLLFHRALRADLENELLSDDTIITASPLINSIIKNL